MSSRDLYFSAVAEGNSSTVDELLTSQPKLLYAKEFNGYSALARAAGEGHTEVVATLLKHGFSSDYIGALGSTAAHAAVEGFDVSLPSLILISEAGANLEIQNQEGETPLMLACSLTNLWALSYLLGRRVSVDRVNKNGVDAKGLLQRSLSSALKEPRKYKDQIQQARTIEQLLDAYVGAMSHNSRKID